MSKSLDRQRNLTGRFGQGIRNRSSRARLAWALAVSAILLVLVFPLSMAFAVHDDGLFELGNPAGDPGSADILGDPGLPEPDWEDIFDQNGDQKPLPPEGVAAVFIKDDLSIVIKINF